MKKISILLAAAAAVLLGACNQAPQANLKSDIDSLSYIIGVANGTSWSEYSAQTGMDSTSMNEFLKGFYEATQIGDNKKKEAYVAGLHMGMQWADKNRGIAKYFNQTIFGQDSTQTLNEKNIYAGFMAVLAGKSIISNDSARAILQTKIEAMQKATREKLYGENKAKGEEFLAKIAKKEGIKSLGNGIYYEVLTEGNGEVPADTCRVKLHYEGKLIDGTVFDSDMEGEPHTMAANQVIPGFKEALTHMPVGSKWVVYIPQDQAYGSQDMGQIKPFSALTFTIELLSIEK